MSSDSHTRSEPPEPAAPWLSIPVAEFEALSDALAWSQQRLRAFGYEVDADEVLGWYGLAYVEPKPRVRRA